MDSWVAGGAAGAVWSHIAVQQVRPAAHDHQHAAGQCHGNYGDEGYGVPGVGVLVAVYLVLNVIVVGSSLWYLLQHPETLERWQQSVASGDWHFHNEFQFGSDWLGIALVCLLLFPKLALGLSGFETGVAVMPLILGRADDTYDRPKGLKNCVMVRMVEPA